MTSLLRSGSGGGSGSGGSLLRGGGYSAPLRTPTKKKGGGGGWRHGWKRIAADIGTFGLADPAVTHLAGNLGRDAKETVYGLPVGLAALGHASYETLAGDLTFDDKRRRKGQKEFADIGRGIGESYKQTYSPLFEGDFSEFGHRLYDHPLGPVLDIASVATLGTGAVVKGATALGKAGEAARALELGMGEKALSVPVRGSELSRRLKLGLDRTLKRLPADFPTLGEEARFGRVLHRQQTYSKIGKELQKGRHEKAFSKLRDPIERYAAGLLHDFPTPQLVQDEIGRLSKVKGAESTVAAMKDALPFVENPTPKMQRLLGEAAKLGDKETELFSGRGVTAKKDGKLYKRPVLSEQGAELRRYQPALVARGAKVDKNGLIAPEGQTIEGMVTQIKQEIAEAGRHEPIFRPQKSVENSSGTHVAHGGIGEPRNPIKNNKAILQSMGRVAYDLDTLTPDWMRKAKWAVYQDRHQDLMDAARRVSPEEAAQLVRSGKFEYVKRNMYERITHTERTGPEFEARLEAMIPDLTDEGIGKLGDELTTALEDEAATEGTNRLVIPVTLKRKVVGEFNRSNDAAHRLARNVTAVWRALVLNTNPAWLTHNLVGNSFLYAIQSEGIKGLKAYLDMVQSAHGPDSVLKLLFDAKVRKGLSPEDMIELMPEQAAGTFFGTQNPTLNRVARAISLPTKPLRYVDVKYEQRLRRLKTNSLLRTDPAFKARWEAMPKEARDFREIARKTLSEDPEAQARISAKVNDVLGDFLAMSDFEQGIIRSAVPFYAWYKAITSVGLKLVLDRPVRVNILTNLGRVGWGESVAQLGPDEIEDYLRTIFITGKGKEGPRGVQIGAFNPFQTTPDVASAVTEGITGDRRKLLGLLNPMLAGAASDRYAKDSLPVAMFKGGFENVPQKRLYDEMRGKKPTDSATYGDQNKLEAVLASIGFPVKEIRTGQAKANYRKYH